MKKDKRSVDKRAKVHYFSWIEYIGLVVIMGVFAAMPGILYGARFTAYGEYLGWYILYWAIVAAIFCAITAYLKYLTFEIPMRRLSEAAHQVANGDFSVYIKPIHTIDKLDYIDVMIQDFNRMVAELGSIETLKNDFISNVSHEIKTPLAVIKNYTTALKKENLPREAQEEYMNTIITATDNLSTLITNILRLNKLENQEIKPKPESYNLSRQLCDCALCFESLWEQKNIQFEVAIEDRVFIAADESMLEIVWNNLLSNALKFTEPGGKVTLYQTSDEHTITVSISDTGCGISDTAIKHIFDKFYQGDTSHSKEGNGLGLALTYRVIEKIGGTITVTSELGKGSTFTVNLLL